MIKLRKWNQNSTGAPGNVSTPKLLMRSSSATDSRTSGLKPPLIKNLIKHKFMLQFTLTKRKITSVIRSSYTSQQYLKRGLFIVLLMLFSCGNITSQTKNEKPVEKWWSDTTESALDQAGGNRQELINALEHVPFDQREGLLFLIDNMPQSDLQSLSANFLLENTTWAYKVLQETPWGNRISKAIFLNDILPYANATESRDNWRKRLYEICYPLVKDCKTSKEAAKILNESIFKLLKVKYSTKRRAADQGPFETMETGLATCTGLSILFVDACRSVGVPARIVGTPLWYNNSGNHTWVEIWDEKWYFTGAAEQNPKGFNLGWFVNNASKAVKDTPRNAIYAASFKKTDTSFPMVWARDVNDVSAVNVTDRYTELAKPEKSAGLKLRVVVFDKPVGERVPANVTITDAADTEVKFNGISKSETADMNDHLFFQLPKHRTYLIKAVYKNQKISQYYTTGSEDENKLSVFLSGIPAVPAPLAPSYSPPKVANPLSENDSVNLRKELTAYFDAPNAQQKNWEFSRKLQKILFKNEPAVRQAVWDAYRNAPVHDSLKQDFDARIVRFGDHMSPYTVKTVGTRPPNGWALFIAMHGGGGTTQEFNDRQWRHMQIYYRDHPEAGGYMYLALRAPDNTWNGLYTSYTYPLIQNLLRQYTLFADIDPNKKFIMGYSHGGYGAFAIGPKMPDYFAAIHSSAASIADGASPITLRNTVFTTMLGSKDTRHGRYDHVLRFQNNIQKLKNGRHDIYPVTVQIIADHLHSGLPDRDKIAEMYPNVRNPVPRDLTWRQTDKVISDFFWLHTSNPERGKEFNVSCHGNHLTALTNLSEASILMDSRLIDFNKPVVLELNGKTFKRKLHPDLRILCETMQRRGDPELAFSAEWRLPIKSISAK